MVWMVYFWGVSNLLNGWSSKQGLPKGGSPFTYYLHTTAIQIPWSMGIVWVPLMGKGVPLLMEACVEFPSIDTIKINDPWGILYQSHGFYGMINNIKAVLWIGTPWKMTWNLKSHWIEKENHLPNLHLWVPCLFCSRVYPLQKTKNKHRPCIM